MFITFEGIEGSGKSTQIALTAAYLQSQGYRLLVTREPGGVELAERIRSILIDPERRITPKSELLLFLAARAQHVEERIKPALDSGCIVLCDRFYDATLAYQGYARGMDLSFIRELNDWATSNLKPNMTFLLDLEPEVGLSRKRLSSQTDRIESEKIEFHRAVRNGYLTIARSEPERFHVLDASRTVNEVQNEIREVIRRCLVR